MFVGTWMPGSMGNQGPSGHVILRYSPTFSNPVHEYGQAYERKKRQSITKVKTHIRLRETIPLGFLIEIISILGHHSKPGRVVRDVKDSFWYELAHDFQIMG